MSAGRGVVTGRSNVSGDKLACLLHVEFLPTSGAKRAKHSNIDVRHTARRLHEETSRSRPGRRGLARHGPPARWAGFDPRLTGIARLRVAQEYPSMRQRA
jgi:hypothetical protein